jgi:uncharacterized damage-inducible protein DinB
VREYLLELARFDAWANAELLAAVRSVKDDEKVSKLLAHLTAAKHSWIARIIGNDVPADFTLWPNWSREESGRRLRLLDRELVAVVTRDEPSRVAAYANQRGAEFESVVSDIVIHLANHGSYHRGQLASAVKNAGGIPAVTDFIAWVRLGKPVVGISGAV